MLLGHFSAIIERSVLTMKYLLDTVAFNNYYRYKQNPNANDYPKQIRVEQFVKFVDDHLADIWIHSGTMFELLIKCFKNNKIQNSYRKNKQINLGQFADDYFFIINKNKFRILNEQTYKFKWEKIIGHYNDDISFDLNDFIKDKVSMEVDALSRHFILVQSICLNKWFDDFGEYNEDGSLDYILDTSWYNEFDNTIKVYTNNKLEEILNFYYYTDETKEMSVDKINFLLGFVLDKTFDFIKNGISQNEKILNNPLDIFTKYNMLMNYCNIITNTEDFGTIHGAKYASLALNPFDTNQKKKHIKLIFNNIFDEFKFTELESKYLYLLVENTFNGTKITKNDFTDYYIISAADHAITQNLADDFTILTYDKKVKNFLMTNNYHYDQDIYTLIYNE